MLRHAPGKRFYPSLLFSGGSSFCLPVPPVVPPALIPRVPRHGPCPFIPPVPSPAPLSDSSFPRCLWERPGRPLPRSHPALTTHVHDCLPWKLWAPAEGAGSESSDTQKGRGPRSPHGSSQAPAWPQPLCPPPSPGAFRWENAISLNLQRICPYKSLRCKTRYTLRCEALSLQFTPGASNSRERNARAF